MIKKRKLLSLVATAGLLMAQFSVPLGQAGVLMGHAEAKDPTSEVVTSDPSKPQAEAVTGNKRELVSDTNDVTVSVKSEAGFGSADTITASLAAAKTDADYKSYSQDIAKVSLALSKQGLAIVDAQVIDLHYQVNQAAAVTMALHIKKDLSLNGISDDHKNIKVGLITSDDMVQIVEATIGLSHANAVNSIGCAGSLSKRVVVVTTAKLEEDKTLALGKYGKLVVDGAVGVAQQKASPYSKPITVTILTPKPSALESSLDSKDFEVVKTIDKLYTWDEHFYLLDFLSNDYEVLKTEYQSAKDSEPKLQDLLFGEYEPNPLATDKGHSNTVNIYIRPRKPLGLKPMPFAANGIQPRAFRSRSVDSASQGELEHHKRIDYLGDNQNNPDTSVDDPGSQHDTSDLYRLYLDMTGKKQPLDVLVVVDRSASMKEGISQNDIPRDQAVKNALTGDNGLLQKFININAENKLSVIGFQGNITHRYSPEKIERTPWGRIYQPSINNNKDADVLKNWENSSALNHNDLSYKDKNGTNYHAALVKADEMLNKVADNGHRKIMVFISDGVPTFYFGPDGYRAGNGTSALADNVQSSQAGTKLAIDDFKKKHPNLSIYSLGVSKDINSDTASSSPVVLKYLSGEDHYYGITNTVELEKIANKIVEDSKVSHLEISDTLSQYVDYYEKQPDVVVTRISKADKSKVETLYKDNTLTSEGQKIIKSVTFTPQETQNSSGKVTLTFKPDYKIDDEYTYTLSFNVKVSDKAYEKYKNQQGKYTTKGDVDTDYGSNNTSSGQDGFYSNREASVNYMADGRWQKLTYKRPVVQLKTIPVAFSKIDANDDKKTLDGVEFELRKEDKTAVWEKGTTAKNGRLVFNYLQKGKTYYLYETKARAGYTLPENPWKIKVDDKGQIRLTHPIEGELQSNHGAYVIKNHKIYQLPSSGGRGSQLFLIFGSMVITIVALLYQRWYNRKQRQQSIM
ncbi:TPA: VWA domain-containing protein [Streptococcus equi subsp. zooepidemicus]|nr:VWA domain-containing protein [Streptococcus equi subsp. zooepidemicus]HEL1084699.1 VWA domain-containing protein [Streptococcus equi subsp. zooepidemicus]